MEYIEFMMALHAILAPKFYLEIGVRRGRSLRLAQCASIGVDPAYDLDYEPRPDTKLFRGKSDAFFASGAIEEVLGSRAIDLAFIDGWHNSEFALRDFINTERYCHPDGAIVFDDVLPRNEDQAVRKPHGRAWTGDVWKIVDIFQRHRPDLKLIYVDVQPTGMLIVQGLDPVSRVLSDAYEIIERELTDANGPLMPPISYGEQFINPSAALKQIAKTASNAPALTLALDPMRDIANIVIVRFSVRMSSDWLIQAYGEEANRAGWIAKRAGLFRETLYRSLKSQTVPPRIVLLLMDEGDRDAYKLYLDFDPALIKPLFVKWGNHLGPMTEAIAQIAQENIALSRIDSDDMVAQSYFESINFAIARTQAQRCSFEYVMAPRGYRFNGDLVQECYYYGSPFLTQFISRYHGEDIYGFQHEWVVEKKFVVSNRARWMQIVHGNNIANSLTSKIVPKDQLTAQSVATPKNPVFLAAQPNPLLRDWPETYQWGKSAILRRNIGVRFLNNSTMIFQFLKDRIDRTNFSISILPLADRNWDVVFVDNKKTMEIQGSCKALEKAFDDYGDSGRGRTLVLDGCNEAFALSEPVQSRIAELTADKLSPFRRVILITHNKALFKHGELRSKNRKGLEYVYFHGFLGHIYKETHKLRLTNPGLLDELWEHRVHTLRADQRRYTCLMNKVTPHRIVVFGHLLRVGALKHGNVSFLGVSACGDAGLKEFIQRALDQYPSFKEEINLVARNDFLNAPFKNFNETLEDRWGLSLTSGAYRNTQVSLVVESEMTDGNLINEQHRQIGKLRFTEKSIKAPLAYTGFIIAGNRGTHPLLKEIGIEDNGLGFEYDQVLGSQQRLTKVLDKFDDYLAGAIKLDVEYFLRNRRIYERFLNASRAHFDQCLDVLIEALMDEE
jgi:hypothetical protein